MLLLTRGLFLHGELTQTCVLFFAFLHVDICWFVGHALKPNSARTCSQARVAAAEAEAARLAAPPARQAAGGTAQRGGEAAAGDAGARLREMAAQLAAQEQQLSALRVEAEVLHPVMRRPAQSTGCGLGSTFHAVHSTSTGNVCAYV